MLQDIFETLSAVTDPYIWGTYAFSRDILRNRVNERDKRDMIIRAAECGAEYARMIMRDYAGCSVETIAEAEGLRVATSGDSLIGGRLLFAQFTPPDEVVIMEEPLRKYEAMLRQEGLFHIPPNADEGDFPHIPLNAGERDISCPLPLAAELYRLLLGHELFHWLEEKNQETIYTRNHKIELWRFWKLSGQSTVRALSELGAMYFTQVLNGVSYSPFIVDGLLFYAYDRDAARDIFDDMVQTVNG